MSNYVLIDTIIFIISNIILAIYFFNNKKLNIKEKIVYTIFFIVLNSSYNIMFVNIHQYNKVIARTAIWKAKFIGFLTIPDIICIIILLFNLKTLLNSILKNKILRIFAMRDIVSYILGMFSFLWMSGYWMDNGRTFMTTSKCWIYTLSTIILTFKYMKKNINLIYPISIILINGWISTLFVPAGYLWIRYGHRVSIIDQEDACTLSLVVLIFFFIKCFYVKEKNGSKQMINFILLIAFSIQNIYCLYKTNLIIIPLMIVVYIIITKGRNQIIILASFFGLPMMFVALSDKIWSIATSLAIKTRMGQLTDYLDYIENKGIFPKIFGLGIGTPYYAPTDTGDTGEIKNIDAMKLGNYKFNLQTQIISIYKDSGLVGLVYFIVLTIYLIFIMQYALKSIVSKKNINNYIKAETMALGIFVLVKMIFEPVLFGGTIPVYLFTTFCLCRFIINCEQIKENRFNENFNN